MNENPTGVDVDDPVLGDTTFRVETRLDRSIVAKRTVGDLYDEKYVLRLSVLPVNGCNESERAVG